MRGIIRLFAEFIASTIQQGSLRHASIGALAGIALAWIIAYMLELTHLTSSWISFGIAASLAGGLAGALIGSLIPDQANLNAQLDSTVVWNLNQAFTAPGTVLILGTIAFIAVLGDRYRSKNPISEQWVWIIGVGSILLTGLVACIPTYGLRIGKEIRSLSILSRRRFSPSQIQRWGFEIARGKFSPIAPDVRTPFFISFDSGYHIFIEVSPAKAKEIAILMPQITKPT
ncbi:MAG TPA: hypothetical protein VHD56_13420 [Tepidisphaeraceae bacterium]|nr:hypothetical protein [Tepidisphaeraceae bacterium]